MCRCLTAPTEVAEKVGLSVPYPRLAFSGGDGKGGLADGEGAVDVDDVVVGEVQSSCDGHDRVGADG